MILDLFKGDMFSLSNMTDAINTLPNRYDYLTRLGLFATKSVNGKTVYIENRNGVLGLVPTITWGGPATQHKTGKRDVRSFMIPHMPIEDRIAAEEVMGIRAFGTESELQTVAARVNEKLQEMKDNIDQTLEYRQMSALKGIILDADGSVMLNLFTEFGVTLKTISFATGNAKSKTLDIKRNTEDNIRGDRITGVSVLCSPEFFDAYTTKGEVEKAFANYQQAQERIGGDLRNGFTFAGVTFIEYRAQVGNQRFIDAGDAWAFPLGTTETFRDYVAPADFIETVNTPGQAYYARQWIDDDNRGVNVHMQANHLPINLRPAAIARLTVA